MAAHIISSGFRVAAFVRFLLVATGTGMKSIRTGFRKRRFRGYLCADADLPAFSTGIADCCLKTADEFRMMRL